MMNDTTTGAKLRPEVKAMWLTALRSGEYEQTRGRLHVYSQGGDRFCCLGVLCELAVEQGVAVEVESEYLADGMKVARYADSTTMPPPAVVGWAYGPDEPPLGEVWNVTAPELASDDREDGDPPYRDSLATLNDDAGLTFEQIAARIEAEL